MKNFLNYCFAAVQNSEFNFFVRSVGHFRLIQADRLSWHDNPQFGEIFWGIAGIGRFVLNGKKYLLNPGYVWYYPPGIKHYFSPAGDFFEYRWITINGTNAATLFDGLGFQPGAHYAGECPEELFTQLQLIIESPERNQRLAAMSLGFSILALAASRKKRHKERKNCAELSKAMIDKDFADPGLTVEHLAETLHVNRVTLSRSFALEYRIPISAYLKGRRVQAALRYLRESKLPVSEIAAECGFSSVSYFIRVIKATVGTSPGKIRKTQ